MKTLKNIGAFLADIAILLGVLLILTQFVVTIGSVSGESMETSLIEGQKLVVDRLTYRFSEPKRFDIVVVKFPDANEVWIKRVIGLPGEKVEHLGGKLFINGKFVEEDFLGPETKTQIFRSNTLYPGTNGVIPEGEYIVMGDNRDVSDDSRNIKNGILTKNDILGSVRLSIYPFDRFGLL
ncbi:signal peptidase I [Erysipelotrichaceae bacterium]|nr:signal peptidase I [Erysipelotrichaceae bacterium]